MTVSERFERVLAAATAAGTPNPLRRFDPEWYRQRFHPDTGADLDALAVYLQQVGRDCHDPNRYFDEAWYRGRYQDVALEVAEGRLVCGFQHYLEGGYAEGRRTCSMVVWESWYLETYPQVGEAILRGEVASATEHYAVFGSVAGLDPHPAFAEGWYRRRYPEVDRLVQSGRLRCGYEHFLRTGLAMGLKPSPEVDDATYRRANEDVDQAVLSGELESAYWHLIGTGLQEGRQWRAIETEAGGPAPQEAQQLVAAGPSVHFPRWNAERLSELAAALVPDARSSAG